MLAFAARRGWTSGGGWVKPPSSRCDFGHVSSNHWEGCFTVSRYFTIDKYRVQAQLKYRVAKNYTKGLNRVTYSAHVANTWKAIRTYKQKFEMLLQMIRGGLPVLR
jgi:hypothetical protein